MNAMTSPFEATSLVSRTSILILAWLLSTLATTQPAGRAELCMGAGAIGLGSYLLLERVARRRLHAYLARKAADLRDGVLHRSGEAWRRQMADALELLALGNQLGVRIHRRHGVSRPTKRKRSP